MTIKYELLIEHDGTIHVLGELEDEFGIRWGPLHGDEERRALDKLERIVGYGPPMDHHARRFELHRDEDVTGVSGTGVVAEGVVFRDGVVAMRWLTEWPTSVVFHDRGQEAVEHVHGHQGRTRIVWIDE